MSPQELFTLVFAKTSATIAYSPRWKNAAGFYDHVVKLDLGLRVGEIATSADAEDRRILLIGTHFGNVVVFERDRAMQGRYDTVDRSEALCSNLPHGLGAFFQGFGGVGSTLTVKGLELLIGDTKSAPNIGNRLAALKPLYDKVA